MRFDVMTIFPQMVESVLSDSIIKRATEKGVIEIYYHNIRDFSKDKHKNTDDEPYGGGNGMVMTCQPIYDCYKYILDEINEKPYVIYMSPGGNVLNQGKVISLSEKENIVILCGHYEGIDQRILEEIVDEEISIGDYVLTGGEIPAAVLIDSVSRMVKGVLSKEECFTDESHYNGLLEYPQYTRPIEFNGKKVPEVLTSGHHKNIENFRKEKSLEKTLKVRPDLIKKGNLTQSEAEYIEKLSRDKG